MTSLAKIGFWFINNIGRKNKITKCYKNAVSGITEVWNIKYTTQKLYPQVYKSFVCMTVPSLLSQDTDN